MATAVAPSLAVPTGTLVLLAAGLAVLAPVPALLVSPLVLGVPHLLGDLWVLFLRPAAIAGLARWVALPLVALLGVRAFGLGGVHAPPLVEVAFGTLAVALGAASTGSVGRVAAALLVCAPAWFFADKIPLVLGHLHNFVALAVLLFWAPGRLGLGVAGAVTAIFVALLAGAADTPLTAFGGLSPSALARTLASGIAEPWATRWTVAYCFAQLVHYLCWIWLLPLLLRDENHDRRPLRRALVADVGRPLLIATALGAAGLLLAALRDPIGVRTGYLSLVAFHGWMELAVLAGWRRGRVAR